MGNTYDGVKAEKKYVTPSTAEDGVAVAIEELVLPGGVPSSS